MDSPLKTAMDKRGLQRRVLRKMPGIHYTYSLRHYRGERKISANHALIYEKIWVSPLRIEARSLGCSTRRVIWQDTGLPEFLDQKTP